LLEDDEIVAGLWSSFQNGIDFGKNFQFVGAMAEAAAKSKGITI